METIYIPSASPKKKVLVACRPVAWYKIVKVPFLQQLPTRSVDCPNVHDNEIVIEIEFFPTVKYHAVRKNYF